MFLLFVFHIHTGGFSVKMTPFLKMEQCVAVQKKIVPTDGYIGSTCGIAGDGLSYKFTLGN